MRTFDYRHLPQRLFDRQVGDANVRLYEDKGKLDLLEQLHGDQLALLRESAHFENVDASTHIEGLYADPGRVRAIVDGSEPVNETEAQLLGYSNALLLVEKHIGELDLSTSTIVKLFETMYAHRDLGTKSRYRKNDYVYVQVDGHMQAMQVSPINAFETPLVLGGACDSLVTAFDADTCSPLILAAVFTVDFLCIRPFDEGNGRIARLFAELMLEKAGFRVARYSSIDRIIENSAMAYYDALNSCVDKWDRGMNDYAPYAHYWLSAIHEAYQNLFAKVELMLSASGKSERVRMYLEQSSGEVNKRMVREALSDVSEATIEAVLGQLVKEGAIEKIGAGRGTRYLWRK
ncbi:MAG: Fic family protein [Eggerthellaceae bacterium]|nr:Fic family protein [Eggerthellaceae bacterium]